jgi:hypothetical protein
MQMLQEEILMLKKNLTDTNVKQIKDKESSIAEKKNALEKHCRQFGMTHGKYGSQESEVKPETTNGEVWKCSVTSLNLELTYHLSILPR